MANQFKIPLDVERAIRARDAVCAYCGCQMQDYPGVRGCPKDKATIEHLNFDGPLYWGGGLDADDIVICCGSCNSSRGTKALEVWFRSTYCIARNINAETVAAPVKAYLKRRAAKLIVAPSST